MNPEQRRRTAASIRNLLDTDGPSVADNTRHLNDQRYAAVADLDEYESLREAARATKEDAIARLPDLVETVRDAVAANGGTVYMAEDAADARRYLREVCTDHDAETVVKSKSMTTEEIDLNDGLERAGVDVYETDLGEFVVQLAEETPSHIVGPAIHRSRADIADLLNDRFDPDEPLESATDMTRFVRDYLGERIREADVGVTGANFVLAESGTVVLVTNEGNARKTAVTPDVHVAVAGVEKLIPSIDDLGPFAELLARSATGQPISQYLSLLTPPTASPTLDFDGAAADSDGGDVDSGNREFHLVLLDNGRTAMREDDQLRETLYCVRCGACSNSCANFQQVGGHGFGGETYSGGIATGWEAGVHGLDSAETFNDLCTGCSRCVTACPVKIDIPWINEVVRDRINRGTDPSTFDHLVSGLVPDEEPAGLDVEKRLFGNAETLFRLGSATAPVSNWLADRGPVRSVLERVAGVDRRRPLPRFQRETLRDWFATRGGPRVPEADAVRSAVLYPDVYTNHVLVDRGRAAVRVLEALGVHVRIPDVPASGRAPLSQGMLATAEERATAVYDALEAHLDADRDVVVVEPSDLAAFEREYGHLLEENAHERLADASYEVLEYVYGLLENGADADALSSPPDAVAYHSHCQQRTLGLEPYTEAVLSDLGADVATSDVECCGMAGSFGYKRAYYDLSMAVGDDLVADLEAVADRPLLASGTSCVEQLGALLDGTVRHPVEVLDPSG